MSSLDLTKDRQKEGFLFFLQLVKEMFFHRSPELHKLPYQNNRGRIIEALTILYNSDDKNKIPKYIPILMDELFSFYNVDDAFQAVFSTRTKYIQFGLKNYTDYNSFKNTLLYVDSHLDREYYITALSLLRDTIDSGKNKTQIYNLTKCFCIELVFRSYSREFIYEIADKTERDLLKTSRGSFTEFASTFDFQREKYVCYAGANEQINFFLKDLIGDSFSIIEPIKDVLGCTKTQFENVCQDHKYMVKFVVDALDYYDAKSIFETFLASLTASATFYNHRTSINWSTNVYVRNEKKGRGRVISESTSGILWRKDFALDRAKSLFNKKLQRIFSQNIPNDTRDKFMSSVVGHSTALQSGQPGTQFISLWSSLETLLPSGKSRDRIKSYVDVMIPPIMLGYNRRVFLSYFSRLKSIYRKEFLNILFEKGRDLGLLERMVRAILLEKYKDQNKQIDALFTQDPLSRFRMNRLVNNYGTPKSILKTIENHEKRIAWQIKRIYMARNSIVHSGKNVHNINILLSNLHEYYDTISINLDLYYDQHRKVLSVESIFDLMKMEYDIYKNILAIACDKKTLCGDNFLSLLGIMKRTEYY